MIVAGTGHRPDKLGGYSNHIYIRLLDLAEAALKKYEPTTVISGMALGWDTAIAEAAIIFSIPLIAAIPCLQQESRWPKPSRDKYNSLLKKAKSLVYVTSEKYSPKVMQIRNKWMVDNCELLLALWDGSSGGTANCLSYAKQIDRRYVNLWNSWRKYEVV